VKVTATASTYFAACLSSVACDLPTTFLSVARASLSAMTVGVSALPTAVTVAARLASRSSASSPK
jgi:hypothetical protein